MRFAIVLLLMVASVSWAAPVEITGVRLWQSPEQTRVVLDATAAADFRVFTLQGPERVVIDIKRARLRAKLPRPRSDWTLLKKIRAASRKQHDLRVVLDLAQSASSVSSFTLPPHKNLGHRIVLELAHAKPQPALEPEPAAATQARRPRDVVVAIDAGHGGEDPGAEGKYGTREKDVVLGIARRLYRLLQDEPGMRPVLIRDGDYYVSLPKRIAKARRHKADLFVSIHADAFHNRRVKGSSVYVLSPKGASDEAARWLAERENAADLVGGVRLDDKEDMLAQVLLDLSLTGTIEVSTTIAERVLKEIGKVGHLHKHSVQSAGFVVLKSPDIPSLLVETAFISNPREERKLKSGHYQDKLARAMLRGIRGYFRSNPPPGTLLAARAAKRAHVIRRGETLSGIAQNYRVSLASLRRANGLKSDRVRAGQVLKIPAI